MHDRLPNGDCGGCDAALNADGEPVESLDPDDARQQLLDMPLSLQVRSGWTDLGETLRPEEFEILLSTGGPAVRIVGDLDQNGEPTSARLEAQDWFTRWFEVFAPHVHTTALEFARQFYFG
jgi:hypothetical protein